MMKHLKLYEDFKNYNYWLVDLTKPDPYFEVCLDKLGVNEEHKKVILYDKKIYGEDLKKAAVVDVGNSGWQWSTQDIMRLVGCNHMGEIIASEKEIEDYKIKKDSKIFNI